MFFKDPRYFLILFDFIFLFWQILTYYFSLIIHIILINIFKNGFFFYNNLYFRLYFFIKFISDNPIFKTCNIRIIDIFQVFFC